MNEDVVQLDQTSSNLSKDNFTGVQYFFKDAVFKARTKLPVQTALPTTCEVGELAIYNNFLYICNTANAWTIVGPTTSLNGITITDCTITGGTMNASLTGDSLNAVILTASDTLQHSADTERSEHTDSYVIQKQITIRQGGTIRVKFDLGGDNNSNSGYARIYVDEVAVGTERQNDGTNTYTTFSQDINVRAFQRVQLYAKDVSGDNSLNAKVRNFRIYYTRSSTATNATVDQN